jgi:hypothetical protein
VTHGDIKPENIVLSPAGPKLIDLGFPASLPEPGSPEKSDARGDQYALASSLYEALTGNPPAPPPPAGTPSAGKVRVPPGAFPERGSEAHVDAVFDCALAPDPRRRFPTCSVFGDSLAEALEVPHGTPPASPTSHSSIVPRATRRWQNAIAGVAVLVIFALIGLGGQRHGASDGVSLKSAARAFAASFGPARATGANGASGPTGPSGPTAPAAPGTGERRVPSAGGNLPATSALQSSAGSGSPSPAPSSFATPGALPSYGQGVSGASSASTGPAARP